MKKLISIFVTCLAALTPAVSRAAAHYSINAAPGIPSGIVLDGNSTHFYNGVGSFVNVLNYTGTNVDYLGADGQWHDFTEFFHTGVGPFSPPQVGDIVFFDGAKWANMHRGGFNTYLTVGDDPGIFGADTNYVWRAIPTSGGGNLFSSDSSGLVNEELAYWADGTGTNLSHSIGIYFTASHGTGLNMQDLIVRAAATVDTLNLSHLNLNSASTIDTLDAGTYTPTATGVTDMNTITPHVCRWTRIGNIVTVSGQIDYSPSSTLNNAAEFRISLPFASDLLAQSDLSGTGATPYQASTPGTTSTVQIFADPANDEADFIFANGGGGTKAVPFTFTYTVQ